MKTNLFLSSLVVASALMVGCRQESPGDAQTAHSSMAFTEDDLKRLIAPGMTAAEVTNTFGSPDLVTETHQDTFLLIYWFPLPAQKKGLHLAGFNIYVKSGNVITWSPIMQEWQETIHAGSEQGSFGEHSFQIFRVTGSLTNLAITVDAEGSADASRLEASPDMAFKAQVFAGIGGGELPGEQTVILVVNDQDAAKLNDLSENNFGERLLIVCHNKVIAAPAVSAPLASKQLIFTVKNPVVLDILRIE
jgi:outer membrane protein assembly factor BamE (lipoprotein component of BamABCDE complex)